VVCVAGVAERSVGKRIRLAEAAGRCAGEMEWSEAQKFNLVELRCAGQNAGGDDVSGSNTMRSRP
jgi:hypothetical protein